jgi:hypothetical protein
MIFRLDVRDTEFCVRVMLVFQLMLFHYSRPIPDNSTSYLEVWVTAQRRIFLQPLRAGMNPALNNEACFAHGDDMSGGSFLEFPFGYVDAKNLTPGKGGAGAEFKDQDWVRAIRHGVNPEGTSLLIMPATAF